MSEIIGKVATVITEKQLAFNVGSDQGVAEGWSVVLFRNVQVKDPDTKESLGVVRLPKLRLRVNHVQARLSTAVVTSNVESSLSSVLAGGSSTKTVTDDPIGAGRDSVYVKIGETAEFLAPGKTTVS